MDVIRPYVVRWTYRVQEAPMRQAAEAILQRWMALDKELCQRGTGDGLELSMFAKKWGVDRKTISRDLAVFKRLGYVAHRSQFEGGIYRWQYAPKQQPMFTATLRLPGKP